MRAKRPRTRSAQHEHDHQIKFGAVHEHAEGVFLHDADGHGQQKHETEKENALEAGAVLGGGAVNFGEDHDECAEADGGHAEGEQDVRRAEDFDVEAVGIVPPVVEGGGGDHADGAPGGNERAEWATESPNGNGVGAERRIFAKSCGRESDSRSRSRREFRKAG